MPSKVSVRNWLRIWSTIAWRMVSFGMSSFFGSYWLWFACANYNWEHLTTKNAIFSYRRSSLCLEPPWKFWFHSCLTLRHCENNDGPVHSETKSNMLYQMELFTVYIRVRMWNVALMTLPQPNTKLSIVWVFECVCSSYSVFFSLYSFFWRANLQKLSVTDITTKQKLIQ